MIIRDRIIRYIQKHGASGSRAISVGIGKKPSSVGPELYALVKSGILRPLGSRRQRTYTATRYATASAAPQVKRAMYERTATPTVIESAEPWISKPGLRKILDLRLAYHEAEVQRTKAMLEALAS